MKNLIMAIAAFFGFNYATAHEPVTKPKPRTTHRTKTASDTTRAKKVETKKVETKKVEKVEKAPVKKEAPASVKIADKKKTNSTTKKAVTVKSKK